MTAQALFTEQRLDPPDEQLLGILRPENLRSAAKNPQTDTRKSRKPSATHRSKTAFETARRDG
jgi:hypothetical protein